MRESIAYNRSYRQVQFMNTLFVCVSSDLLVGMSCICTTNFVVELFRYIQISLYNSVFLLEFFIVSN